MKQTSIPLFSVILLALIFITGCSGVVKNAHAAEVKATAAPATNKPIAKIFIYEDGSYELKGANGSASKKCRIKPDKTTPPRCTGVGDGGLMQMKAIPLLITKGSICVIVENSNGELEEICYPPK